MRIYEIGTGYTSIPADKGAATEIVVENLSRALIKQGHDVLVVDIEDPQRLPTDLPIAEVPMPAGFGATDEALGIRHKLKRVVYSLALAKKLKSLLKGETEPVVLHFHNQYNAFFFLKTVGAAYRDKTVIAYTNHSYVWHGAWDDIENVVKRRYFQEIYCMKHVDLCFVLNDIALGNIAGHVGVPRERMQLIANGVNVEDYRPLPAEDAASLRVELGLEGRRVVIQVGSVCDRKNQLGAVQLLEPLMQSYPDLCYVYVGGVIDEGYQRSIARFAVEHGLEDRVLYLGETRPGEELNRYYNLAEALVFPTKAEAFSLVVIEAMSSGIPAILPKNLQLKPAGCMVYGNAEEFERVFEREVLDESRRKANAEACRSAIVTEYSWEAVARHYAEGFEGALCERFGGGT